MKRLFLMVVVALSMTTAFAAEENTANVNNVNAYDMSINMRKLGECLGLTFDQMESVSDIHRVFCGEMIMASQAAAQDRAEMVEKAVNKDLKYMKYILTESQYDKYLVLLNTTISNRGLNK